MNVFFNSRIMGKLTKVIVCGSRGCGKTSILEQLIYNQTKSPNQIYPTIEDIYTAHIETDRGTRERVMFYDTAGLDSKSRELPQHYHQLADGYVLVYAINSKESFEILDHIKKEIEKHKEKKEVVVIALGNKCDLERDRLLDTRSIQVWAHKEKVRLFEVSITDRKKLIEAFIYLTSKLNPPPNISSMANPTITYQFSVASQKAHDTKLYNVGIYIKLQLYKSSFAPLGRKTKAGTINMEL
ncbi:NF-kappa-B inhibitor-interacting Ras-like protein 2 [Nymphon striatum]|nr:NF-kappa-B inhibitor-interacting Ras-like protein 2 [Nymphon striatum]